jgi:hypothetical protein
MGSVPAFNQWLASQSTVPTARKAWDAGIAAAKAQLVRQAGLSINPERFFFFNEAASRITDWQQDEDQDE